MNPANRPGSDDWIRLLATGVSLGLLLMLVRAQVISFHYLPSIFARAAAFGLAAYRDFLYVAVIIAAFSAVLLFVRGPRARRVLGGIFLGLAIFSLLVALVNAKLVPMLGRPINYQWLYYSDFLRSREARHAILVELSWTLLLIAAASVIGLLVASAVLSRALNLLLGRFEPRRLWVSAAAALMVYFLVGGILLSRRHWPAARLENPIVSFISSLVTARRSPRLLTMTTTVGTEDFEPARQASSSDSAIARRTARQIRNVLVVVLESVPAKYLEAFGGPHPVTPELSKKKKHSALFTNIYAHCPETSRSLVSLLMSIYPQISYKSLTVEQPAVALPSLSSELKRHGYRTAFFNGADNRYQNADSFLSHRQFDKIEDYRGVPCQTPVLEASSEGWPFLDGNDDMCTAEALIEWINGDSEPPFLAVVWTMMTHYPYFAASGERHLGATGDFNRYLNALSHDDSLIGKLFLALEERGLDRSTLVVIVGDHGEAFGQHDQRFHARHLYEENVHVPLMMIHPDLFHGEELRVIGGLIDVAPTILETLGFTAPASWQGRSLWSTRRSGRVYFFASSSDHLFGLRERDTKVIYNADDNRFEVYDLAADPHETVNRADAMRGAIEVWQQRLAAWVQYQAKLMREPDAQTTR